MDINGCLATDDNYTKYCATTISSVVKNKADDDNLKFYILYSNLSDENKEKLKKIANIEFCFVNDDDLLPYFKNTKVIKSVATYYRIKLPSLLNRDRVIYLDCDIIVRSSLKSFYEKDFENNYLAAAEDISPKGSLRRLNLDENGFYFNAGSILLNLKKMREDNIEQQLLQTLSQADEPYLFADQDVLNITLFGKVQQIENIYNYIPLSAYQSNKDSLDCQDEPIVLHFAGSKPWEIGFKSAWKDEFWNHFYSAVGIIPEEEYIKSHRKYCFSKTKLYQLFLYLKLYPFPFSKYKFTQFCKILFDF